MSYAAKRMANKYVSLGETKKNVNRTKKKKNPKKTKTKKTRASFFPFSYTGYFAKAKMPNRSSRSEIRKIYTFLKRISVRGNAKQPRSRFELALSIPSPTGGASRLCLNICSTLCGTVIRVFTNGLGDQKL